METSIGCLLVMSSGRPWDVILPSGLLLELQKFSNYNLEAQKLLSYWERSV